jgi:tRNA threonylcarbamoyladenosine biosynthesis protein TsaE
VPEPPVGEHRSDSPADTERLGASIAAALAPGDLVLLAGELGTGKTTLVRGASRALGVRTPVTSPTFTLGRRYAAAVPVFHVDLHRLDRLDAEDAALLDDYLADDAITFVEWPDVAEPALGRPALRVMLEHAGGDTRRITVTRPR